MPVITAFSDLNDSVQGKVSVFQQTDATLQGYGNVLDEAELEANIQSFQKMTSALSSLKRATPIGKSLVQQAMAPLQAMTKNEQKRLQALKEAQQKTKSLFDAEDDVIAQIARGLAAINDSTMNPDGSLNISADSDWLKSVEHYSDHKLDYILATISYPAGLDAAGRKEYRAAVKKQLKKLSKEGWPASSQLAYVKYLNKHQQKASLKTVDMQHLNHIYKQSQTVGSKVFMDMWNVWQLDKSPAIAKQKLTTLTKVLQVPGNLPEDAESTRKLLAHFDKKLAPNNKFWDSLAKTVQTAFPTENGLNDGSNLGQKIHNLRYIISAQQAQYIRDNYPGKTDAEKLANYMKDCGKGSYELEGSRLHQKMNRSTGEYPQGYGKGDYKVTQNFHTEFLLNSEGKFQNEIDPDGINLNGQINGASFNYGNKKGNTHKYLDINVVHDLDPQWRHDKSSGYKSPLLEEEAKKLGKPQNSYTEPHGNYSINGQSSKDNATQLGHEFDQMVKGQ
ncbi:DUF3114 domain-containing protein [Bombilactobacillus thymidiniphilus]|uniref:DUF3114 domain-containing protein n=1 Tax=Bombilactobacillus thymidiniphilus TaxID=2923363 RepID=A0ABY4PF82_9LACO|nr:DUF3114 domain-containing protein [Bombilactobacillus thymidiniphilus]UQS84196.1 DUF3114 domain-containing protein [Bombilactobacillus thymidiniphilus]